MLRANETLGACDTEGLIQRGFGDAAGENKIATSRPRQAQFSLSPAVRTKRQGLSPKKSKAPRRRHGRSKTPNCVNGILRNERSIEPPVLADGGAK